MIPEKYPIFKFNQQITEICIWITNAKMDLWLTEPLLGIRVRTFNLINKTCLILDFNYVDMAI